MGLFSKKKEKEISPEEEIFVCEKKIGKLIEVDYTHKLLLAFPKTAFMPRTFIPFDNIISYEIRQNDKEIIKRSGLGRAAAGGLLFGPAGAIVGAATGSSKTVGTVSNISITIETNSENKKEKKVFIPYLAMRKIKTNSLEYKDIMKDLESLVGVLDDILDKSVPQSNLSAADEIKKFKELLDMDVITQDEFDTKKKELLGL